MKTILSIEAEIAIDIAFAMQESFDTRSTNFKESSYTPNAFKTLATRVGAANGGRKADDVFANGNLTQNASMHKGWVTGLITNSKFGVMKLA